MHWENTYAVMVCVTRIMVSQLQHVLLTVLVQEERLERVGQEEEGEEVEELLLVRVQEEERLSCTMNLVVHPQAVDRRIAALSRRVCHRLTFRSGRSRGTFCLREYRWGRQGCARDQCTCHKRSALHVTVLHIGA